MAVIRGSLEQIVKAVQTLLARLVEGPSENPDGRMYRNMTTNYGKNMVASCVCTVHSARPPRGWLRAGG